MFTITNPRATVLNIPGLNPIGPFETVTLDETRQVTEDLIAAAVFAVRGIIFVSQNFFTLPIFQQVLANVPNGSEPADAQAVWSTTDNAVRAFSGGNQGSPTLGSGWRTLGQDVWQVGGNSALPAMVGSMVALPGGKAIYCGGVAFSESGGVPVLVTDPGYVAVDTVSIFDPATGRWARVAPMPAARWGAGIAFLPTLNKVLVVGGYSGNAAAASIVDTTFIYDIATNVWTDLGAPGVYPSKVAWGYTYTGTLSGGLCNLKNGKVLAVGGLSSTPNPAGDVGFAQVQGVDGLDTGAVFNPGTLTWTAVANTLAFKTYESHLVRLASGKVLITGGADLGPGFNGFFQAFATCEVYDPATNLFAVVASMPSVPTEDVAPFNNPGNRTRHIALALPDGRAFVGAGRVITDHPGFPMFNTGGSRQSCLVYDPQTDVWTVTAVMPLTARDNMIGCVLPGGKVYVGAGDQGSFEAVDGAIYDPETDTWATGASQPSAGPSVFSGIPTAFYTSISEVSDVLSDGRLMICGGFQSLATLNPFFPRGGVPDFLTPANSKTLLYTPPSDLRSPTAPPI